MAGYRVPRHPRIDRDARRQTRLARIAGLVILWLIVLVMTFVAHRHIPDQHLPWKPLSVVDPVGLATRVKAAVCRGGGPVLFGRARGQAPGSGRVFAPQSPAGLIGMTRATCVPFEDVTAAAGIERYDLASIDVEGSEFDILQSFDWRHVHVDVFIFILIIN